MKGDWLGVVPSGTSVHMASEKEKQERSWEVNLGNRDSDLCGRRF